MENGVILIFTKRIQFFFKNKEAREAFKENLKAYRENSQAPIRVIRRREFKIA